jgi:hypothetical protein
MGVGGTNAHGPSAKIFWFFFFKKEPLFTGAEK